MLKRQLKRLKRKCKMLQHVVSYLVLVFLAATLMIGCAGHVNYKILSQERIVGKLTNDCQLCIPREDEEYDCFLLNNVNDLDQLIVLHLGWYLQIMEELSFCYEKNSTIPDPAD